MLPILDETHSLKCELAGEVLRSSGNLRLQVTGWSMVPTLWPGDILMIARVDPALLSEGDIVLIDRDRRLFAHRLLAKNFENSGILTRGDSMRSPDPRVAPNKLLGKVSFILRNGRCIEPRPTMRVSERAVAALVQRSEIAARAVMSVHSLLQPSQIHSS